MPNEPFESQGHVFDTQSDQSDPRDCIQATVTTLTSSLNYLI